MAVPCKATSLNLARKPSSPKCLVGAVGATVLAALISLCVWKLEQESNAKEKGKLQGELQEHLIAIKVIDPNDARKFFEENQNASIKSLRQVVTRFNALVAKKQSGEQISHDEVSALRKEGDDIYQRSKMNK